MILSAQEITKGYADKTILQTMSVDIEENDRIGLIGVNGAGKTTLLRLLSGIEDRILVLSVGKRILQSDIFVSTVDFPVAIPFGKK